MLAKPVTAAGAGSEVGRSPNPVAGLGEAPVPVEPEVPQRALGAGQLLETTPSSSGRWNALLDLDLGAAAGGRAQGAISQPAWREVRRLGALADRPAEDGHRLPVEQ